MSAQTDDSKRMKRKPPKQNVYELFYLSPELLCECNDRMFSWGVYNLQVNESNCEA